MDVPEDFLAKILKTLVDQGLVKSTRGPHGGYALARNPIDISFLDVIVAVEGPVALNVCLDGEDACGHSTACTMVDVWRQGQERMLDVYRQSKLAALAFKSSADGQVGLVQLAMPSSLASRPS
jgi:Rrf2 family protein